MMMTVMIIAMIIKRNWSAAGHATLTVFRTQTRFAEKVARTVANSPSDPGEAVQVHRNTCRSGEGEKREARGEKGARILRGGAMTRANFLNTRLLRLFGDDFVDLIRALI